jgi:hypothetical protein
MIRSVIMALEKLTTVFYKALFSKLIGWLVWFAHNDFV